MISHTHKIIFVGIMKTGCTSIRELLKNYGLASDWWQRGDHRRARELYKVEEYRIHWDDYFKFSFVRNPWSLLVSWYHYDNLGFPSFSDYVNNRGWYEPIWTFRGCLDRLVDENGNIMVDFIGKLENIEKDFAEICRRIGIDAQLSHLNKTIHRPYRDYYNDDMKKIVQIEFEEDIKYFGYAF